MSIHLKKVELENIRSHKKFTLAPENEGVTAISGPNGSGKSTVVDSVAWALYGQKPPGVSKMVEIARKGCTPGKDSVSAKVLLEIDGEDLLIERRIVSKAGGVECDVWTVDEKDKRIHLAGPAVSHVEPVIRKRIGLNAQGFLAAVLVQQKQVDQLITSSPKERTKVIERLTGVDSITNAYQRAREEYNSLKRVLSSSPELDSESDLQGELDKVLGQYDKASKRVASLSDKLSGSSASLVENRYTLNVQSNLREQRREASESYMVASAQLEETANMLEEVIQERTVAKQRMGRKTGESLQEATEALRTAQERQEGLLRQEAVLGAKIADSDSTIASYTPLIEKSKASSIEEAKKKVAELSKKVTELEKKIEDKEREESKAQATIAQFENAIYVLGGGACPTCLQEVPDTSVAVGELKGKIEALKDVCVDSEWYSELSKLRKKQAGWESVVVALEEIETAMNGKKKASGELVQVEGFLKTAGMELSSARGRFEIASRSQELRSAYEKVSQKARNLIERREELSKTVSKADQELKGLKVPSDKAFEALSKKVEKFRVTVEDTRVKLSEATGEEKLLLERSRNLSEKIDTVKKAKKEHQKLLDSMEIASSSSSLLEEFRVNRINTSIPLLESYASDLLNRFTEGKFIGLKLDAKFNAKVVLSDGTDRPIGLLSGGELSAAAIALRLAISMMLNTDSGNSLIILDEVLVSQDRDRAEIILNTIAEVAQGQVLIIAHNDSIDAVADKVVSLD